MSRNYEAMIKAYMEQYHCSEEEADKAIQEIKQQQMNDFYGYSKYSGQQV